MQNDICVFTQSTTRSTRIQRVGAPKVQDELMYRYHWVVGHSAWGRWILERSTSPTLSVFTSSFTRSSLSFSYTFLSGLHLLLPLLEIEVVVLVFNDLLAHRTLCICPKLPEYLSRLSFFTTLSPVGFAEDRS